MSQGPETQPQYQPESAVNVYDLVQVVNDSPTTSWVELSPYTREGQLSETSRTFSLHRDAPIARIQQGDVEQTLHAVLFVPKDETSTSAAAAEDKYVGIVGIQYASGFRGVVPVLLPRPEDLSPDAPENSANVALSKIVPGARLDDRNQQHASVTVGERTIISHNQDNGLVTVTHEDYGSSAHLAVATSEFYGANPFGDFWALDPEHLIEAQNSAWQEYHEKEAAVQAAEQQRIAEERARFEAEQAAAEALWAERAAAQAEQRQRDEEEQQYYQRLYEAAEAARRAQETQVADASQQQYATADQTAYGNGYFFVPEPQTQSGQSFFGAHAPQEQFQQPVYAEASYAGQGAETNNPYANGYRYQPDSGYAYQQTTTPEGPPTINLRLLGPQADTVYDTNMWQQTGSASTPANPGYWQ